MGVGVIVMERGGWCEDVELEEHDRGVKRVESGERCAVESGEGSREAVGKGRTVRQGSHTLD